MDQAQSNDDVYICPHFREAYLRAAGAGQNGNPPLNLNDASGILDNSRRAGETVSSLANGALRTAGFTENGIRARSLASSIQSSVGSVRKGSAFAKVQGRGQKGGFSKDGILTLAVAGVVAAATIGWNIWSNYKRRQEEEEQVNQGLEALARASGGRLLCDLCRMEEGPRGEQ